MKRTTLFLSFCFLFCVLFVNAQEVQKSELQQRAEAVDVKVDIAKARSMYIRAFEDYANQGQIRQGAECAAKAATLYYKENFYKEAFDLMRRLDQAINASKTDASTKAASHYIATKERMQMYLKLRKGANVLDQLNIMETLAAQTNEENIKNDLLYCKAIYYYTFGQNAQGNAVFKEMASKLTAQKEYDKVDEVYQTLIANGRKSNSASLVAQSYSQYILWKDSVTAQKYADEINSLKQQIAENEQTIDEKDSTLSMRQVIIVGLCILLAALAAALVIGGIVLLRFVMLTRKQKKTIKLANDSNALKAKFISNISAQLAPTFKKLDGSQPEVKALLAFSDHIQELSTLENSTETIEMEDVPLQPFCEEIVSHIQGKVKSDVTVTVNAPKLSAKINKEYVSHILLHLLNNAAEYTPAGGTIWLDFKKRSPHTHQFMVSNTGEAIPEEKHEDVFKPFLEIHDLTKGDGLGLPICKQMAMRMNGDLEIDSTFTKGTRFVLDLHV